MNIQLKNMSNKEKIIKFISENGQQTIKELSEKLEISLSMTHRHIKELLLDGFIKKVGSAPFVFYILSENNQKFKDFNLNEEFKKIIEDNFLFISPQGQRFDGVEGFFSWCEKRGFNFEKKAQEYTEIYKKYDNFKKAGVISGILKLKETFQENCCVDDVFFSDFYAWEIFGKTKLGQLLLYSKQSQNKVIMKEVVEKIEKDVQNIIKNHKIDAVGFIPPTVKRQVQFMKFLEQNLKISLPKIKLVKVATEIVTPQKTLNKLQDRIENANSTIFVDERNKYKNVLLIDDALGSGATLNQVSCKIKKGKIAKKVFGYAAVGSLKGFDVINEV